MEFFDINGIALRPGQRVAWATVGRGGTLATGQVIDTRVVSEQLHRPLSEVRVILDSNARPVWLPYNRQKFVVLSYKGD